MVVFVKITITILFSLDNNHLDYRTALLHILYFILLTVLFFITGYCLPKVLICIISYGWSLLQGRKTGQAQTLLLCGTRPSKLWCTLTTACSNGIILIKSYIYTSNVGGMAILIDRLGRRQKSLCFSDLLDGQGFANLNGDAYVIYIILLWLCQC